MLWMRKRKKVHLRRITVLKLSHFFLQTYCNELKEITKLPFYVLYEAYDLHIRKQITHYEKCVNAIWKVPNKRKPFCMSH